MYGAYGRRDLGAFLAHCAPDVSISSSLGSYPPGRGGVRAWWNDIAEAFDTSEPRPALIVELGDLIVAVAETTWRGRSSEVEFPAARAHVSRWRDGRVVWWGFYPTLDGALEAAELTGGRAEGWQLVRAALELAEAFNERDTERLVGAVHEDVEVRGRIVAAAEEGVWRGPEGVRDWLRETYATFEEFRAEVEEMRVLGDRVVTVTHVRARESAGGAELDTPAVYVTTFRDGLVVRHESYADLVEAAAVAEIERDQAG